MRANPVVVRPPIFNDDAGFARAHVYYFITPNIEACFEDVMLPINGFESLAAIDPAEDMDDFFRAMKFVFHEDFLIGKR